MAIIGLATAHAETRPSYRGRLEAPLLGAPATFDPVDARSHGEITVVELLFDTLYRTVEPSTGAPYLSPHLAAAMPEVDTAKLTARIAIRRGVKFHDGSTLTPQDVAASLDRARAGAGRWALAPIAAVKANGGDVELTLRHAEVDVATMLSLVPTAITRGGKSPGLRPIGTGAFRVETFDRANNKLVLDAFEDHFAGRTYLERLTLRWYAKADEEASRFEHDNSQFSARGPSAFATGQPKFKANDKESPQVLLVFVGFGRKHAAVTGDRGFRRALELAIDRNALASVQHGERVMPAGEPLPFLTSNVQPSQLVLYGDLAQAKAVFATAAQRVPQLAAPNLTLEVAFEDTRPDDRLVADRIVRALGKLGIAATLTPLSAVELRERVARGTLDLWIGHLAVPYTVSWAWWAAAFTAGGDDWATTKLAAGRLDNAVARAEYANRRPIVPLVYRTIKLWHRGDIQALRFDVTGRPCFAELFLFGAPMKAKVTP